MNESTITDSIITVLSEDDRVLFAFLYGSGAQGGKGKDIDIAVYAINEDALYSLSADLKVALHKGTGLPPDIFDVRVINGILKHGDIFGLLYLRNVLSESKLLIDRNPDVRAEFLEYYGSRFRECEGFIREVLE